MHVNGPKRTLQNCECKIMTLERHNKLFKAEICGDCIFEVYVFLFQELGLQRFLNTFIYNAMASSKKTNKTSYNSETSEGEKKTFDLSCGLGIPQIYNYPSQTVLLIHTVPLMQWYFATSKAPGWNIDTHQKHGPVLVCNIYQNHRLVHMLIATNHTPYLHISCYFTCIICPLCTGILFNFQTMQYERVLVTHSRNFLGSLCHTLKVSKTFIRYFREMPYTATSLDHQGKEVTR